MRPTTNLDYLAIAVGWDPSGTTSQTVEVEFNWIDINMSKLNMFPRGGYNNASLGNTSIYGGLYARAPLTFGTSGGGVNASPNATNPLDYAVFIRDGLFLKDNGAIAEVNKDVATPKVDFYMNKPQSGLSGQSGVGHVYPYCPIINNPVVTRESYLASAYAQQASGEGTKTFTNLVVGGSGNTVPTSSTANRGFYINTGAMPQTLVCSGTVCVTGTVTIHGPISYRGSGVIQATGSISIDHAAGSDKKIPAFVPDVAGYTMNAGNFWSPLRRGCAIGLIAGDSADPPASITFDTSNQANPIYEDMPDWAGAFFATGNMRILAANCFLKGSMFADTLQSSGNNVDIATDPNLWSYMPVGMPKVASAAQSTIGLWTRK